MEISKDITVIVSIIYTIGMKVFVFKYLLPLYGSGGALTSQLKFSLKGKPRESENSV